MKAEFENGLAQDGETWSVALYYWALSFVALLRGNKKETRFYIAQGWRVARRLKSNGQEAPFWMLQRAYSLLMRAHNQWCDYKTSINFANRILEMIEADKQDEESNTQAVVSASLGESFFNLGQYQTAKQKFERCYDLALKAGDPRLQGDALNGLGMVYYELGLFDSAEEFANQEIALVVHSNDVAREVQARMILMRIAIIRGEQKENIPILENFLMLARFQQADPYAVKILLSLGETHLSLEQVDPAREYIQEAAEMS